MMGSWKGRGNHIHIVVPLRLLVDILVIMLVDNIMLQSHVLFKEIVCNRKTSRMAYTGKIYHK